MELLEMKAVKQVIENIGDYTEEQVRQAYASLEHHRNEASAHNKKVEAAFSNLKSKVDQYFEGLFADDPQKKDDFFQTTMELDGIDTIYQPKIDYQNDIAVNDQVKDNIKSECIKDYTREGNKYITVSINSKNITNAFYDGALPDYIKPHVKPVRTQVIKMTRRKK